MQINLNRHQLFRVSRYAGIGICLAVIIWSLWPNARQTNKLSRVMQTEAMGIDFDCDLFYQLLDSNIAFSYPHSMRYLEVDMATLMIQPDQSGDRPGSGDCSLVIETYLDLPDVGLQPSARIFEPLTASKGMNLKFEMTADRNLQVAAGNFWLFANITRGLQANQTIRVPIFVVPVQIRIFNLFGIGLTQLRNAAVVILFSLLVSPIFVKIFK